MSVREGESECERGRERVNVREEGREYVFMCVRVHAGTALTQRVEMHALPQALTGCGVGLLTQRRSFIFKFYWHFHYTVQ